jgi:hypothetical protein
LKEWVEHNSSNQNMMRKIKETLTVWADNHQTSSFFTLGLQFKLPKPDDPMFTGGKTTSSYLGKENPLRASLVHMDLQC